MFSLNPRASDSARSLLEETEAARHSTLLSVATGDQANVQDNSRALTTAGRTIDALERSALAAREGQRRIIEEIGPIAHALQGLLDIMIADGAEGKGPDPAQFGLLRGWTHDLVHAVRRHQDAAAPSAVAHADIGAIVDDAVALFRDKCDALGHTVVLSGPPEPILAPIDPRRLQGALRQLIESVFDREARDRRIDIVLWRSLEECRLAFVSGPPVRRGFETTEDGPPPPPVRPAEPADTRFMGALAQLRELGAVVETNCADALGSNLLVSLPVA